MGMGQREAAKVMIAYCRVSTAEQGNEGHSLDDQENVLRALGAANGWEVRVVREVGSGKSITSRPLLVEALHDLDSGEAHLLAAVRLDRLSRSVADFAGLLDRADRKGWNLQVHDLGLDTTTASGRMVAQIMAATAEHERRLIGERTKEGLRAAKRKGVRLGRPVVLPDSVRQNVVQLRQQGVSLRGIAERLNEAGTPTAHGGKRWYASTVRNVLEQLEAAA